MRIIGGSLRGRRINPPSHMPHTRPTTDIAKEGLFNMLQHRLNFDEIFTLDLFGGTGCISYELASRGCPDLTVVEQDPKMLAFIQSNVQALKIPQLKVVRQDVFRFIQQCPNQFDFIFAGPPYALSEIDDLPRLILSKPLLKPHGLFILEHTPRNDYQTFEGFEKMRNYGTTVFSFFGLPEKMEY